MYASFFGIEESPFSISPDPRYLYLSRHHEEALACLLYGVQEGGGFVLLTGEVGTGKTTVCRCLLEQLPAEVDAALLLNPRLSELELLAALCDELGIGYPRETSSLKRLTDLLNEHLLRTHAAGHRTVAIIDEAQNLGPEALEQVRLLTNLETERHKLLQIILIGQPELREQLARPELRQLSQRITARYHLPPLAADETVAYIGHRLGVAGLRERVVPVAARHRAHRHAGGVPRLINSICDRALLGAYARDRDSVDAAMIDEAANEVLGPNPGAGRGGAGRPLGVALAAVLTLAAASAVLVGWQRGLQPGLGEATAGMAASEAREPVPPPAPGESSSGAEPAAADDPSPVPWRAALQRAGSIEAAMAALLSLWGQDYGALPGISPCSRAGAAGLQCLQGSDGWAGLAARDRAALLRLELPEWGTRYATLVAAEGESHRIALAGEEYRLPAADWQKYWQGEYLTLWRAPSPGLRELHPGMRGSDVRWVRERLGAAGAADPELYDDALRERVLAFQRDRALRPDGIVGPRTLIRMSALNPGADEPLLSAAD